MSRAEHDPDAVEVRPSRIHGLGLYAIKAFEAGDVVLSWDLSRVISNNELSTLTDSERCYTHPFNEDLTLLVQPPERFVNHSCNNNTVVEDFRDVAIRRIEIGEEITSNYLLDGSTSSFVCTCGELTCRGTLRSLE